MSPLTWDQPYHAGALQLGRWEQPYHRVKKTLIHGGIYKSCVIPYIRTSNENISGEVIQLKIKAFSVSTMLGVGTRVQEIREEETRCCLQDVTRSLALLPAPRGIVIEGHAWPQPARSLVSVQAAAHTPSPALLVQAQIGRSFQRAIWKYLYNF